MASANASSSTGRRYSPSGVAEDQALRDRRAYQVPSGASRGVASPHLTVAPAGSASSPIRPRDTSERDPDRHPFVALCGRAPCSPATANEATRSLQRNPRGPTAPTGRWPTARCGARGRELLATRPDDQRVLGEGRRSRSRIKHKHRRRERLLVSGWRERPGELPEFLLARRGADGRLRPAGSASLGLDTERCGGLLR